MSLVDILTTASGLAEKLVRQVRARWTVRIWEEALRRMGIDACCMHTWWAEKARQRGTGLASKQAEQASSKRRAYVVEASRAPRRGALRPNTGVQQPACRPS